MKVLTGRTRYCNVNVGLFGPTVLVLEVEESTDVGPYGSKAYTQGNEASHILRAALAEPEPVQEPYCHVYEYDSVFGLHRDFYPREYNGRKPDRTVPLFSAPPQRPESWPARSKT